MFFWSWRLGFWVAGTFNLGVNSYSSYEILFSAGMTGLLVLLIRRHLWLLFLSLLAESLSSYGCSAP